MVLQKKIAQTDHKIKVKNIERINHIKEEIKKTMNKFHCLKEKQHALYYSNQL